MMRAVSRVPPRSSVGARHSRREREMLLPSSRWQGGRNGRSHIGTDHDEANLQRRLRVACELNRVFRLGSARRGQDAVLRVLWPRVLPRAAAVVAIGPGAGERRHAAVSGAPGSKGGRARSEPQGPPPTFALLRRVT